MARRIIRWLGFAALGLLAVLLLLLAFLHTPPGRQFIVNQIAKVAPASGLHVEVGSIEGSVLWSSTLHDVKFYDADNVLFLEVPTVDLNWRPLNWFTYGLDLRYLVLTDGRLHALPNLLPADPDAPILPDFNIRVDRFVIDDLTVDEAVLGEERTVDFNAHALVESGQVMVDADGELGGGDVFDMLVHAEPDGDSFDLDLDWQAPAGGLLAGLVGAQQDLRVQARGEGGWSNWQGKLEAQQGEVQLADVDLYNESGQYRLVGEARPAGWLEGLPARALGDLVQFSLSGTLENSVVEGDFVLRGQRVNADGAGAVDLAGNRFDGLAFTAQLLDPTLFSPDVALEGATLEATLDGPFRDIAMPHVLRVAQITSGDLRLSDMTQRGTLTWDGARARVPLQLAVGRVVSGNAMFDPRLVNGTGRGTLVYAGNAILADDLDLRFPGLTARLGLNADLASGLTRVNGPVQLADLQFDNVGMVDANADIRLQLGGGAPWAMRAELRGQVDEVTNSTLASLAGPQIAFDGGLVLGGAQPLLFQSFDINAAKLTATLDGRVEQGVTTLAGAGRHADYGPFNVEATLADDGPRATLVFADPLPAAGLADVRVALAPTEDGFQIDTQGGSMLGPFAGQLFLAIAEAGDTTINIARLDVAQTRVAGTLNLVDGGVAGSLAVSRGGLDGTIDLARRQGGQGFDVALEARNARFTGDTPLAINRGTINASGLIVDGNSTITGNANLQGLTYDSLFLGRLAAQAEVTNGAGHFDAAMAGRRGSRFELLVNGDVAADRLALAAQGSYGGRAIAMPRRAVLTRTEDGGWLLDRSQLTYGDGFLIAEGRFGGTRPTDMQLAMGDLSLDLVGAVTGDLGLGGELSGTARLGTGAGGLPVGEARLQVHGLTRSGLLLTSSPLDIALVADLSEQVLQTRAVLADDSGARGRLQARIAGLPQAGALGDRLYAGNLAGQFRFNGSAATLWRLAAIDLVDVTGPVAVAADLSGSLGAPRLSGSLAGDDLRLRSALLGADVTGVAARGRFAGSRFALTSFSGSTGNGGQVSGSGVIDMAGISSTRGPRIDLRMAAREARILDLDNMGATVTGPIRIVSNGQGGTVAGRLTARRAHWRLGQAEAVAQLPQVAVTEINLPGDVAPPPASSQPWRYLVDISAPGGIMVDGMGLDSEWRTDNLMLRGTTDDPRLGGSVSIVPRQGFYSFAGTRFSITRGNIAFDQNVPIDPRIDLLAETDVNDLAVSVTVRGNASQPDVIFASTPALPEEELLARLLFGGSITDLSATDAVQLASAVASLRGGAGMGPINRLRSSIGLDRLRLVPADPALGRNTALALGENFGRRFYVEIITDGAGYNATDLEFRVTGWLNLLASVSTVGRHQVAAEVRRDY
ncbi:MAG: translocation/assembly module TamB domain-containing protein [Erythrobacter sp.]|nr:translocation/assembly module TamB domain-containing protein [Erythrobacter sp.]